MRILKHSHKYLPILMTTVCWISIASSGERIQNIEKKSPPVKFHLNRNYQVISESVRFVTAYNVGDPKQNDGNPCISANGENICTALESGAKRCAANFVPFGTKLLIQNYGIFEVTDRMHSRYRDRVDIAMKLTELRKAKIFGKKKLFVKVLKKVEPKSAKNNLQIGSKRLSDTRTALLDYPLEYGAGWHRLHSTPAIDQTAWHH